MHNNREVLDYWNENEVESMYDKHLLNNEIEIIRKRLVPGSKILDAGCGEGEGTLVYSSLPNTTVHAVDFSETRLKKAAQRLAGRKNVTLKKVDFLADHELDSDYDAIVSQRLLINLMEWDLQKRVLLDLMSMLKPSGRLLMLEGSRQGVDALNQYRGLWGLEPIPVKWHNLFLDDEQLQSFMAEHGFKLVDHDGLGSYFLLTRGMRPLFEKELNWDCRFNEIAASEEVANSLGFGANFSRLKFWAFQK